MTVNKADLLPLELWLSKHSGNKSRFPEGADYFDRYMNIKNWLRSNVYRFVDAALSAEAAAKDLDGTIHFTSHGPDHFDSVIRYAGLITGVDPDPKQCAIDEYEVYLLLCAILLHDAGNIYGRDSHTKNAFMILRDMGDTSGKNEFEKKIISTIAEAHSGISQIGDKDTIGAIKLADTMNSLRFRATLLAAIVRIADEVSEDYRRAALYPLEKTKVSRNSEIYHKYAESIKSVSFEYNQKAVSIEFFLQKADVLKRFGKNGSEAFLVDEIFERLEKMNRERIYCSRFMTDEINVRRIKAQISVVDENHDPVKEPLTINLEDTGYPEEVNLDIATKNPGWTGENLMQEFERI